LSGHGLKLLSLLYIGASVLVASEVLGLWGGFVTASTMAQVWKVYFSFCNLIAGLMLLFPGKTTQLVFIFILLAQLAVYVMWSHALEYQVATLCFYFVTLVFYFGLLTRRFRRLPV
jgi:hypothetical protein